MWFFPVHGTRLRRNVEYETLSLDDYSTTTHLGLSLRYSRFPIPCTHHDGKRPMMGNNCQMRRSSVSRLLQSYLGRTAPLNATTTEYFNALNFCHGESWILSIVAMFPHVLSRPAGGFSIADSEPHFYRLCSLKSSDFTRASLPPFVSHTSALRQAGVVSGYGVERKAHHGQSHGRHTATCMRNVNIESGRFHEGQPGSCSLRGDRSSSRSCDQRGLGTTAAHGAQARQLCRQARFYTATASPAVASPHQRASAGRLLSSKTQGSRATKSAGVRAGSEPGRGAGREVCAGREEQWEEKKLNPAVRSKSTCVRTREVRHTEGMPPSLELNCVCVCVCVCVSVCVHACVLACM